MGGKVLTSRRTSARTQSWAPAAGTPLLSSGALPQVILCFSPVGSTLRVRARRFPAVVNCTAIDWFHEWPEDALLSVSSRFLEETRDIEVSWVSAHCTRAQPSVLGELGKPACAGAAVCPGLTVWHDPGHWGQGRSLQQAGTNLPSFLVRPQTTTPKNSLERAAFPQCSPG